MWPPSSTDYDSEEDAKADIYKEYVDENFIFIQHPNGSSYLDKKSIERIFENQGTIFIRTDSADVIATEFKSLEEALQTCLK